LAAKAGYKNLKVYVDGLPAWGAAGNIVLTTCNFVSKQLPSRNIVVIDTRSPEAAKKGHIPGAVSIPLEKMISETNQFPLDKEAYIVLYSQDTNMAGMAPVVKKMGPLGYENILVLDGGYSAWLKNGRPVKTGKAATKIAYFPDPRPNEVTVAEFLNTSNNKPAKKMIIDVRTKAEASAGMVKNAINIPAAELKGRLKELPKDKELIIYSGTGVRAAIAHTILKQAGFKVKFLNNNVSIINNKVYCGYM